MVTGFQSLRLVVFSCGDLGAEVANALRGMACVREVTLITAPFKRKQLSLTGKIRHVYRTQGPLGLVSVVTDKLWGIFDKGTEVGEPAQVGSLDRAIKRHHFRDFHDKDCLEFLRDLQPDLGVIAGTYILKEAVFAIPRLGSINLHTGKVPKYRGAAPAFWELLNGESEVGITIHKVVAQIDAGSVLLRETYPLDIAPEGDPMDYIERYRRHVLRPNGVRMLAEAVAKIADGTVQEQPQDHACAKIYKTPDYKAICDLRRQVRLRRGKEIRKWTRHIKSFLGRVAYYSGLYRRFLTNKAIIVLFHRVDDDLIRDPISCTSGEFRSFCHFFRRYFKVVSLRELLQKLDKGEDLSRHLVITFDDGYRDNWRVAAPELARLRLPCCFFVATDLISSRETPWWDSKNAVRTEWMTWEDVRHLHGQGFEIGAHTMTHANLGELPGEVAAAEIAGSKKRLETELGETVLYFSYPYGGRAEMTEESREAVRRAGYQCCLSAYGGAVTLQPDYFDLKRTAISHWHISPYQFGFEAMFFKP